MTAARGGALGDDRWQRGVVYQIYPRSFADSDGDGLGDLPGIIAHLDHLNAGHATPGSSLGVDAIWLSPIYPSPDHDLGYDVADYTAVDPRFGSLVDFDRLVTEAHARGLRIILDLVMNHTSHESAWFRASRASRTGPYADWYLWRDPRGRDRRGRPRPPNGWVSYFGGSAWTWEPARGQFYLHTFLPEQPDLNWRQPAVRAAMLDVVRFWLARGVDGFRLDVFNVFFKHPDLPDNPPRRVSRWRRAGWRAWDRQEHIYDKDQPEMADLLAEFRAILDAAPGRMSVGELFTGDPAWAASYAAPRHLIFDFGLLLQPWAADRLAEAISDAETAFGPDRWPAVVLSNHDQSRHATRLSRGRSRDRDAIARAAAVLLLTLRGTPFLYAGEEIGLGDARVPRWAMQDPPARRYWPLPVWFDRDRCRGPMPWTGGRNGGFTTGRPWSRMADDYATRNVAGQAADPDSILACYRRLIALRHRSEALSVGGFDWHVRGEHDVLAWLRTAGEQRMLVALTTASTDRTVALDGLPGRAEGVFSSLGPNVAPLIEGDRIHLRPLEAVIVALA
ncbi:MAG TPA: alpha-glucosidase [Candidatus Limnocylindrales bacterium]